jgi:hypothetical protein
VCLGADGLTDLGCVNDKVSSLLIARALIFIPIDQPLSDSLETLKVKK